MSVAEAWSDLTSFKFVDAWNELISDIPSQAAPDDVASQDPGTVGKNLDAIPTYDFTYANTDFLGTLNDSAASIMRPIYSSIEDFFVGAGQTVASGISAAYNGAASATNAAVSSITQPFTTAENNIASIVNTGTSIAKWSLYIGLGAVLLTAYNTFPKYRILTYITGGLLIWHFFLKPNESQ